MATTRPERGKIEDPGGGPAEQHIFELKRLVEAIKSDAAGIDAPNKTRKTWPHQTDQSSNTGNRNSHAPCGHTPCRPIPTLKS
jgi:hypothetical protein